MHFVRETVPKKPPIFYLLKLFVHAISCPGCELSHKIMQIPLFFQEIAVLISAFYHQVSVGHVEAGLRTYDKYSPFPEEMNRKLVSSIADLYFCPTVNNKNNLLKEAITDGLFITGNTVIDALKTTVKPDYHFSTELLNRLDYEGKKIILVTCHRRENYGAICEKIGEVMELAKKA